MQTAQSSLNMLLEASISQFGLSQDELHPLKGEPSYAPSSQFILVCFQFDGTLVALKSHPLRFERPFYNQYLVLNASFGYYKNIFDAD